jgi:NADH-quinone oxidoreductase subunit J
MTSVLAQVTDAAKGGDVMVAQNIFFAVIAAIMVFSAFRVVTTKNVVHAALYLVLVLAGVGGIYVLLTAEFIAVVQVMVYIGAVVVLMLFGVMLTEARLGEDQDLNNDYRGPAVVTAASLLAVMGFAVWDYFEDAKLPDDSALPVQTGEWVSDQIFGTYLIPFEALSVLLLAALIGAIVLARKE